MMIYLDLPQSRREHPNENWARELMELFTVGIGNYSEQDMRESARAFTGYRLNFATQQFWFARNQHDDRPRRFIGRTGNFEWRRHHRYSVTKQPACAQFIGEKLCRYFVKTIHRQRWWMRWRLVCAHNFEMKPVLREIFSSTEFYRAAEHAQPNQEPGRNSSSKRARCWDASCRRRQSLQNAMRQMGQLLFAPPNVKGWDGGKSWISTSTLLFRNNFANYLINGDAMLPDAGRGKGGDRGVKAGARAIVAQQFHREPVDVDLDGAARDTQRS